MPWSTAVEEVAASKLAKTMTSTKGRKTTTTTTIGILGMVHHTCCNREDGAHHIFEALDPHEAHKERTTNRP